MGFGFCRSWDGDDDYMTFGTTSSHKWTHDNANIKFTLLCWLSIDNAVVTGWGSFFNSNDGNSAQVGMATAVSNASGTPHVFIVKGVGGQYVVNANVGEQYPDDTDWHRCMFTYDHSLGADNFEFFLDGTSMGTANKGAAAPSAANSTFAPQIGRLTTGGVHYWEGKMSFEALFDRIMTADEADDWFFRHKPEDAHGCTGNSIMFYHGMKSASPEYDFSGDGYPATVVGCTQLAEGPHSMGGTGMGVI